MTFNCMESCEGTLWAIQTVVCLNEVWVTILSTRDNERIDSNIAASTAEGTEPKADGGESSFIDGGSQACSLHKLHGICENCFKDCQRVWWQGACLVAFLFLVRLLLDWGAHLGISANITGYRFLPLSARSHRFTGLFNFMNNVGVVVHKSSLHQCPSSINFTWHLYSVSPVLQYLAVNFFATRAYAIKFHKKLPKQCNPVGTSLRWARHTDYGANKS